LSNAILIAFDHFGIHYVVSCVVAFGFTLILAYGMHTRWTFGAARSLIGLLRYGAAMALNLPVSVALFFVLVTLCGLPMVVAAPTATVILTLFNYLAAATLIGTRPRC
jgi:putative flippase GtrA